ncbi:MAG: collagen-like protein [Bacteroidota bacterium]
MKKAALVFGTLITLFFISCEGPQGPPGFDGRDGLNGLDGLDGEPGILAQVFEVDGVDFAYNPGANIHETIITFGEHTDFETLVGDAVLVYIFDQVVEFEDGSTEDSWILIPQNFFLNEGIIQYVPSHTSADVNIFIEGEFDLSGLDTDFTQNQLFRIVILPRDTSGSAKSESLKMDTSNIDSVMRSLGIGEEDVKKIQMN